MHHGECGREGASGGASWSLFGDGLSWERRAFVECDLGWAAAGVTVRAARKQNPAATSTLLAAFRLCLHLDRAHPKEAEPGLHLNPMHRKEAGPRRPSRYSPASASPPSGTPRSPSTSSCAEEEAKLSGGGEGG